MTMRVLVTGGAGFIGSHVVRRLMRAGCEVAVVVRPGTPLTPFIDVANRLTILEADLRSAVGLARSLAAIDPDMCLHLAWYTAPGRYLHAFENLDAVEGSSILLKALSETSCRRIIVVGSCAEYALRAGCVDEDSVIAPRTLYAACKHAVWMMAEQVARRRGWTAATARLFQVYGPGEPDTRLIPTVIADLLAGRQCSLTSGDQLRDFLHAEDVADAIWAVAASDIEGPVNVACGVPTSVSDVSREIARQLGRPDLLAFGARPTPADDPAWLCAMPGRLHNTLSWRPRFELAAGLEQTIEWWRRRIGDAGHMSAVSK